jgi:hypothetical protein
MNYGTEDHPCSVPPPPDRKPMVFKAGTIVHQCGIPVRLLADVPIESLTLESNDMYTVNPAPDAAAPTVPSGKSGTGWVSRWRSETPT